MILEWKWPLVVGKKKKKRKIKTGVRKGTPVSSGSLTSVSSNNFRPKQITLINVNISDFHLVCLKLLKVLLIKEHMKHCKITSNTIGDGDSVKSIIILKYRKSEKMFSEICYFKFIPVNMCISQKNNAMQLEKYSEFKKNKLPWSWEFGDTFCHYNKIKVYD